MHARRLFMPAVGIAAILGTSLAATPVAARSGGVTPTVSGTTVADYNGDGYEDLAIGAPGDDVGGARRAGVVHILYGSATGLTTAGRQLFSQDSPNVADKAEAGDGFGSALAAGDFDGDGDAELIIGVPGEDEEAMAPAVAGGEVPPFGKNVGGVHLFTGGPGGLLPTGPDFVRGGLFFDGPATFFGAALVTLDGWITGDFGEVGSDGKAELAIGVPGYDDARGAVLTLFGPDRIYYGFRPGDRFGSVLAAGDFQATGADDLAIGAPFGDVPSSPTSGPSPSGGAPIVDAGYVRIVDDYFEGEFDIIVLYQDGPGIGSASEVGDRFGSALAVGELANTTPYFFQELAIGTPGEDLAGKTDVGLVQVIEFTSVAGVIADDESVSVDQQLVPGNAGAGDRFGSALAVGGFGAPGWEGGLDLAVGAPRRDVGGQADAGAIYVLGFAENGDLVASGNRLITQDTTGIAEKSEAGDRFGSWLSSGDWDDDGPSDLAVGVPLEDLGTVANAGLVHAFYGDGAVFLDDARDRTWKQGGAVGETPQRGDKFGAATR